MSSDPVPHLPLNTIDDTLIRDVAGHEYQTAGWPRKLDNNHRSSLAKPNQWRAGGEIEDWIERIIT